jgi:nicotinate-nucleotide adenylyltransferase
VKTLIVGGTFNPIHIGHLFLAEEAVVQEHFERVLFVPSSKPAHKTIEGTTSAQRLAMLSLALEGTGFELETCELRREGISYSIDTVRGVLESRYVTGKPTLLLGDDLFESFHTWKDAGELCRLAEVLVARRHHSQPLQSTWPHKLLANKYLDVSSTEIRARVRAGGAWKALVPPAVARYIVENGLYLEQKQ